jgi:hypothetical protein
MKKFFSHLLREIFNFGIGWVFGLLATQLILLFFEERGFSNLWGLWSNKMVVEEKTLSIIEWLASAVIGYVVMMQVNKIMEKLKQKYYKQNEPHKN